MEHIYQNFTEKMGIIIQKEGLPRIAGRILGLMIIKGQSYSFSELSEVLQVSRASISNNTRLLENLGIIERIALSGERQDYFRLRKDPYKAFMRSVQERLNDAIETIDETIDEVGDRDEGAKSRLESLRTFWGELYQATKPLSK